VSIVQINIDHATAKGLTSLAAARGILPAELVAEIVTQYVSVHAPETNGLRDEPSSAASDTTEPDPVAEILVKRLGWAPDDPRLVNRRRSPLDAFVGSGDYDPVDDIDEVIYGR
jgi:hypothetical protein